MGQSSSTPSSSHSSASASRNGRRTTLAPVPPHLHPQPQPTRAVSSSAIGHLSTPTTPTQPMAAHQQPPSPQQPTTPSSSSSSRVLRSTAERRRRANLFSSFYPLLSRSSSNSVNNSNANSGNASPDPSQGAASPAGSGRGESSTPSTATSLSRPGPSPVSSSSVPGGSSSRTNSSRPDRPPSRTSAQAGTSGLVPRSSTRSPGLQPPRESFGRTPRGLSRVQRMYDEQSIRSTRSSSRASSIVAASPPMNTPFVNTSSLQGSAAEYMDVDPESVGFVPQEQPSAAEVYSHATETAQSTLPTSSRHGELQNQHLTYPAFDHAMTHRTEQPLARTALSTHSRARASQEPVSSASSTAAVSDHDSLYGGLSYPRGGTSISSSLLPIRPDSDDDDDMEHDMDLDHDTSMAQGAASALDAQTQARINEASRPGRFPDAEVVADLIHRQFMQSLLEVADAAPSSTALASSDNANSDTQDHLQGHQHELSNIADAGGSSSAVNLQEQGEGSLERSPATHRQRLRSSSLRGLLGFQPTDELDTEERPNAQAAALDSTAGSTATNTPAEDGSRPVNSIDRSQFLLSQLPFFMRLLADVSRMRPTNETDSENAEGATDSVEHSPSTDAGTSGAHVTPAPAYGTEGASTEATAGTPGTTERPRRHHTTIRFIQIGGGFGAGRARTGAPATGRDESEGEASLGQPGQPAQSGQSGQGGNAGRPAEDFGEAVIMLLTGPEGDGLSDTESTDSSAPESSDDPDAPRARPRHRSPWVVMTLSGAYLSSLMAAGAEGEGGANYDDLWMLANLIGPARPITTTQEAIENAGFAVGQFEQEVQGMRNISTLGDGSKCLVCMSEYEEGEDMRALKCRHGFHMECIDKWLTTGANKCPVCRAAAVISETPPVEPEVSIHPSTSEE